MKSIWTGIQVGLTAIGGFLGWFWGGMDGLIYALIAFVVVDYVTGVMRGIIEKNLSSRIGARGIFKKILIFLLVGIGHLADVYLLSDGNALRTAVLFFYLSNEGIFVAGKRRVYRLAHTRKVKGRSGSASHA
jgi:toxin secretion/phage lysis holin